jgi:N-acetylmuramoyl-L-alanine amidase
MIFYRTLLFVILIFFASFSSAQTDSLSVKLDYHNNKIRKYLDKENALSGFYSIDQAGISMFANAAAKQQKKAEFFIQWKDIPGFCEDIYNNRGFDIYKAGKYIPGLDRPRETQPDRSVQKLKGIRIALDPGHIAGDFMIGELEGKHLKFAKDSLHGLNDSIEIAEGMLTFATASLLKQQLEAEGAEVLLTRKCNGCTAFGKNFQSWKKDDYKNTVDSLYTLGRISLSQKKFFLSPKATDRDIFRVIFKDFELQERAELINNFKPDITVIIHFNVDETNRNWIKPGTKNYNMAFVGGAFMKSDLSTMEKRFEFLRLLVTSDIENSTALSEKVLNNMEDILKVPLAGKNDATYLKEGCLPANEKGVYCRNLQLTRYVHGTLMYGESLYQDNISECQMLNLETDKTKNKRIQQVAESYYLGIINYYQTEKK